MHSSLTHLPPPQAQILQAIEARTEDDDFGKHFLSRSTSKIRAGNGRALEYTTTVSRTVTVGESGEVPVTNGEELRIPSDLRVLHYFDLVVRSRAEVLGTGGNGTGSPTGSPSTDKLFRSPSRLANGNTMIEFPSGFSLEFQRTLRVPDNPEDDQEYALPPGLGPFPLKRMADMTGGEQRLPDSIRRRGGVVMPMYAHSSLPPSCRHPFLTTPLCT